ncbi:MAG: hypothetical protein JOZ01_03505 [Candidatus Eremiobacteraeota bacterium]|nr:hypothetical protein [Candidatus Eremiobacteraeota bacterium]
MTTTQRLHFSMLSAPVAAMDRRGLSQAWYSALYGEGAPRGQVIMHHSGCAFEIHAGKRIGTGPFHERSVDRAPRPLANLLSKPATAIAGERRAQRSTLAQAMETKLFTRTGAFRSAATFRLDDGARVRVFLKSSGNAMHIVAVCPPRSSAVVAGALAHVRFALARRGIAVHGRTIVEQPR